MATQPGDKRKVGALTIIAACYLALDVLDARARRK